MGYFRFEKIVGSLEQLQREVAAVPELQKQEEIIGDIVKTIKNPFLIMVMGEFSTGKSTFINALVGQDIAKVDAKPTTAVITKLVYGASDQITVVFRDGSRTNYDTDSFAQLTAETDSAANALHESIDYVERAMPIEILKSMSIIDSPGLNSIKAAHEETTSRFMDTADTVIWLMDAETPGKQTEIDALKRLNLHLAPLVLVNKIDKIDEDEGDSAEQIIADIERKLRNNQLKVQKVLGISAKMAFQGKAKQNEALIKASNIDAFYTIIKNTLLPGYQVYKRNFVFDHLAMVVFRAGSIAAIQRHASITEILRSIADVFSDRIRDVCSRSAIAAFFARIFSSYNDDDTSPDFFSQAERTFLAVCYWLGINARQDARFAVEILKEAADYSDRTAQMILADIFFQRDDRKQGMRWVEKLSAHNPQLHFENVVTMYRVGECYENGDGTEPDAEKARIWYEKAAEVGFGDALLRLGLLYEAGNGIQRDMQKAVYYLNKAAAAGKIEAALKLGDMYYNGRGVPKDMDAAEFFLRKAACDGHDATAAYQLGDIYCNKTNIPKNSALPEAMRFFQIAADAGNAEAMCRISDMLCDGNGGIPRDYNKAVRLLEDAVKGGSSDAAYKLGRLYYYGNETQDSNYVILGSDHGKALTWYKTAAEMGNADAMLTLGDLYSNQFPRADSDHKVIRTDTKKAAEWYQKATKAGKNAGNWQKKLSALEKTQAAQKKRNDETFDQSRGCFGCLGFIVSIVVLVYVLARLSGGKPNELAAWCGIIILYCIFKKIFW